MFELSVNKLIQWALVLGLLVFFAANWFVGAYKPRSTHDPVGFEIHEPQYKAQTAPGSSGNHSRSSQIERDYSQNQRPKRKYSSFYRNWF